MALPGLALLLPPLLGLLLPRGAAAGTPPLLGDAYRELCRWVRGGAAAVCPCARVPAAGGPRPGERGRCGWGLPPEPASAPARAQAFAGCSSPAPPRQCRELGEEGERCGRGQCRAACK